MVFGRASETYTMPGITSDLSRSRQSGPLEVLTTDASGNLASDGGSIFSELDRLSGVDAKLHKDINRVESGVAVAMSAVGPDLTGVERFGLSLNWGGFEGASAIGGGATGVVYRGQASRLAVTGGIGVGVDGENAVGGRAGGQLTW
jgi:trimeric autotransporter adhesin